MYLAKDPKDSILNDHYDRYAGIVKARFNHLLDGKIIQTSRYGVTYNLEIKTTATRDFLTKYSQDEHLRRLLTGDFKVLKSILKEIEALDPNFTIPITSGKHNSNKNDPESYNVDDLHAIFHQIFVKEIYEDCNVFDKNLLVQQKDLKICPYCGALPIQKFKGTHNSDVKPVNEHYLPKSLFPYFAISFYNIFPACSTCNDSDNKGTNNPLTADFSQERLMHPHNFDNSALTFKGSYNGNGDMNPDNFSLTVDYAEQRFREGYNDVVAIENFYRTQNNDIRDIRNNLWNRNNDYRNFVNKFGIDPGIEFFKPSLILGFEESLDVARYREKYKFKMDLYHHFLSQLPPLSAPSAP